MAEATTRVAINEDLMLCVFAIFLVDFCGSPARDNCTHYLCWTNSTCCDSRSYRPSGGLWAFTFLVGGLFGGGKAPTGWERSQNYWPSKILLLRSIIPLRLFNDGNLCLYNALQMAYKFYCCAFACLITMGGAEWQGVVLLIQPPKPTCFQEAKFGSFPKVVPQAHTPTHSKEIPWKNVKKTR
jgi:hypothetical protein